MLCFFRRFRGVQDSRSSLFAFELDHRRFRVALRFRRKRLFRFPVVALRTVVCLQTGLCVKASTAKVRFGHGDKVKAVVLRVDPKSRGVR